MMTIGSTGTCTNPETFPSSHLPFCCWQPEHLSCLHKAIWSLCTLRSPFNNVRIKKENWKANSNFKKLGTYICKRVYVLQQLHHPSHIFPVYFFLLPLLLIHNVLASTKNHLLFQNLKRKKSNYCFSLSSKCCTAGDFWCWMSWTTKYVRSISKNSK